MFDNSLVTNIFFSSVPIVILSIIYLFIKKNKNFNKGFFVYVMFLLFLFINLYNKTLALLVIIVSLVAVYFFLKPNKNMIKYFLIFCLLNFILGYGLMVLDK